MVHPAAPRVDHLVLVLSLDRASEPVWEPGPEADSEPAVEADLAVAPAVPQAEADLAVPPAVPPAVPQAAHPADIPDQVRVPALVSETTIARSGAAHKSPGAVQPLATWL